MFALCHSTNLLYMFYLIVIQLYEVDTYFITVFKYYNIERKGNQIAIKLAKQ